MYVVALAVAVLISVRRWEAQGGSRALVYDVAMWGFPAGLIGGRLYFDLTSSGEVPAHWWGPFAVWDGGMGIWGGIALGSAVGIWRLRRAGVSPAPFLDAAAPALLVAQAIGRVGNYFNQELFGGPTSLPWALQISPAHRPIGYASFATFHPTFLYELIWNLALAAFLVWLGHHRRIRPPGLFALYVAGYSAFRIFEESLRVDPAHHIFGLRLNFYVATLLCLAGLAWFAWSQGWRPGLRTRRGAALMLAGGIVLCRDLLGVGTPTLGRDSTASALVARIFSVVGLELRSPPFMHRLPPPRICLCLLALVGLVAVCAAIAGCGGTGSAATDQSAEEGAAATDESKYSGGEASPPEPAAPLQLRNYRGQTIDLSQYQGKAVLVTFIYTHCPDVCPLIVSHIKTALALLGPDAGKLQVIAVSTDPRGDNPKTVAAFLKERGMTGRMQYLIGSRAELGRVWKDWNIVAKPDKSGRDLVEHSALIYGIAADGKITTLYPANFSPSQLAHDVPLLEEQ